jgi:hypothetical protein
MHPRVPYNKGVATVGTLVTTGSTTYTHTHTQTQTHKHTRTHGAAKATEEASKKCTHVFPILRRHGGEALRMVCGFADLGQPVFRIVDGEHHFWLAQPEVVVVIPVVARCRGCGPVMAVDDVRLPPCLEQEFQRSLHNQKSPL